MSSINRGNLAMIVQLYIPLLHNIDTYVLNE